MKKQKIIKAVVVVISAIIFCALLKTNERKVEASSTKVQETNIKYISASVAIFDEEKFDLKYSNNVSKSILFPTKEKLAETNDEYQKIYTGIDFPFLIDEDGLYSFNSNNYHIVKDYNEKKYNLYSDKKGNFYPYESDGEIKNNRFFTMKLEIPFIMTENGKVKNCKTGQYEDMTLELTIDANATVYIDGDLILDLSENNTGIINLCQNGNLSAGEHKATVYYIDRSENGSNINMKFNLENIGVKIKSIDEANSKIIETRYRTGLEGDSFSVTAKKYPGYELISKYNGFVVLLENGIQEVNFLYKKEQDLIISYIDKLSNEKIAEDIITHMYCGDSYTSQAKEIKDYTLVETPGNAEGVVKDYNYIVEYYYKYSNAKININYIDKVSGKILDKETKIGIDGDTLELEDKNFENYKLVEKPTEIKFSKKEQTIDLYYIHQSKVTVNYIDTTNNKKLENSTELYVDEGQTYKPVLKEFDNYKLTDKPEKEEYVIGTNDIEINYYYRELLYNVKVEMSMKKATIDERYYELKGTLGKVETENSVNDDSQAKIYYTIKVTNDEEREGSCKLVAEVPNGYIATTIENPLWTINNNNMEINIDNLKPNETKEYGITLTKSNGSSIFGIVKMTAKASTELKETKTNDNEVSNELVIITRTGAIIIRITWALILSIIVFLVVLLIKKKKLKHNKKRKKFYKLRDIANKKLRKV